MKGRKILDIKSDNVGRLNIDFLSTGTYYLINETRIGKFVKKQNTDAIPVLKNGMNMGYSISISRFSI